MFSSQEKWVHELRSLVVQHGNFVLKSGAKSNVYADFRVIPQHPKIMARVCWEMSRLISCSERSEPIFVGVPLGGIPFASTLASLCKRPLWLYRPNRMKKQHGISTDTNNNNKQEEEKSKENKRKPIVIVEDVITVGTSVLEVVRELQEQGHHVCEIVCILDRRPIPTPMNGIPVRSLFTSSFLSEKEEEEEPSSVQQKTEANALKQIKKNEHRQRLESQKEKSRLIVAIDIPDIHQALHLIKSVASSVCAIKLHLDIFTAQEQEMLRYWIPYWKKKYGFLVIEDRKLSDIGYVMMLQAQRIPSYVDMITCHGITGKESIEALDSVGFGLLPVVELSSSNNLIDYVYQYRLLDMLKHCKNIAGLITQHPVDGYLCLSPGFQSKQQEQNDGKGQQYKGIDDMTTDFCIMGRSVYNSLDPRTTALEFSRHIAKSKL